MLALVIWAAIVAGAVELFGPTGGGIAFAVVFLIGWFCYPR